MVNNNDKRRVISRNRNVMRNEINSGVMHTSRINYCLQSRNNDAVAVSKTRSRTLTVRHFLAFVSCVFQEITLIVAA